MGALLMSDTPTRVFTDQEIDLLSAFADQAALELHNAQLYKQARDARDFLRSVAENSVDVIITTDVQGRITYFSPGAELSFGYRAEEVVHRRAAVFYRGGFKEAYTVMRRLMAEGRFRDYETAVRAKDGRWVDVNGSFSLLRDMSGAITGTLAVIRDVTERKRAEDAVRESKKRYHTLAEISPVGIFHADALGRCLYVNKRWCQIAGLSPKEAKEKGWTQALHPDDLVRVATEWRRAATENLQFRSEYRFRRQDGATTWVLGQAVAERGPDGEVTSYVGTITDITDRKQAEEATKALVEVGRELAGTLDLTPAINQIVSTVLRLFDVRHAALYGLDTATDTLTCVAVAGEAEPSRWIGQTFPATMGVAGTAIAEGRLVWSSDVLTDPQITFPEWAADNVRREGLRSVAAIPLIARGSRLGVLVLADVVSRSFTERELELLSAFAHQAALALQNARLYQEARQACQELLQTRDELIQAQKMEAIGLLAGGIAHDFNNMLTVIGGRSELVALKLAPDHPLRRQADIIRKVVGQGTALTQQLLTFSRKQVLQPKVLNLNAFLTDLVPMLRRLIGEDIDLVFVPQPELGQVRADPTRMEQVILNLIINARDAMPRGGRLTLETGNVEVNGGFALRHPGVCPGQYVRLMVRDTGIGMDEKTRSRIFEPFFTTKDPGTGLGLSTVYGIVRQHEGHIFVESELGQGSTFTAYLPRVEGAAASPVESRTTDARSLPGSETILLVEDEAEVRDLAREVLTSCGYIVLEARHGGEGLLAGEQHHGIIHLLVTDVVMPQMSGPELAERLARVHPKMKVLYLSGHMGDALARRGFSDSSHILAKPFTPLTLARRARDVLDDGAATLPDKTQLPPLTPAATRASARSARRIRTAQRSPP